MKNDGLRANLLLLIVAFIWGTTFVAQRIGMEHIGPMLYNAARYALAFVVLYPLAYWQSQTQQKPMTQSIYFWPSIFGGLALFMGSTFQQVGLVYTTAGKAGFITGLYVVLVPILGYFVNHKARVTGWIGALFAALGLYFLSVTEAFTIEYGDVLELIGAVFWAWHILIVARYSSTLEPFAFVGFQSLVCAILSLIGALLTEDIAVSYIIDATFPIMYGGILSAGIAYSIQVFAQKHTHASHAAIILCLEAVFAAAAGWLILQETLTSRALMGCGLMLFGMLIAQLPGRKKA